MPGLGRPAHPTFAHPSPLATIANGQVFDVSLTVTSPTEPGGQFGNCLESQLALIQQLTYQFAFTRDATGLSLTIAAAQLSSSTVGIMGAPPDATLDPSPVAADGSVANVAVSGLPASPPRHLQLSVARMSATPGPAGTAGLQLGDVSGELQEYTGEFVLQCSFHATGTAALDRTPPTAYFAGACAANGNGCVLLADSAVRLWFSEPVMLGGIDTLLSATTDDGTRVRLLPALVPQSPAYTLTVQGFWPLGRQVTLQVASGLRDRAGNISTQPFSQSFSIVSDPGSLDDGNNSGFETGGFSGYSLQTLVTYRQELSPDMHVRAGAATPDTYAQVVGSTDGVDPTEGQYMASFSDSSECAVGEYTLTSRFVIADSVSQLVLDDDFLTKRGYDNEPDEQQTLPLIVATLRTDTGFRTVQQLWPRTADLTDTGNGAHHTGWQRLRIPVDDLGGQDAVLTLHLQPTYDRGEAIFNQCFHGTLLLDNLRFE